MSELCLIATHDNQKIGNKIAKILGTKLLRYKLKYDEIGETDIELLDSVRDSDVYIIAGYANETNNALMELFILIQACKLASANKIVTILPYFPYSKLCKTKNKRKAIPAKLVAQFLEMSGSSHTIVLDLHAPQIHAFFNNPLDNLLSRPFIVKYINEKILCTRKHAHAGVINTTMPLPQAPNREDFVIIAKNPGGAKLCTDIAHTLRLAFALIFQQYQIEEQPESFRGETQPTVESPSTKLYKAHKVTRDVSLSIIGNVANKTAIIIDDLMSGSGSWIKAANCAKAAGCPQVYCIAIHGTLGPTDAAELHKCEAIDKIFLTNTIPVAPEIEGFTPKFEILDISPLFGEAIRRTYNGESLSFLYNNVPF